MKSIAMKFSLLSLIFLLSMSQSFGQKKKFLTTQEEVMEAAYTTLDQWMESGELKTAIEKGLDKATGVEQISGKFIYDITLRKKGEVASVFKVDSEAAIEVQNYLTNYLKTLKFPFKMPKNKSFKLRYEFNF